MAEEMWEFSLKAWVCLLHAHDLVIGVRRCPIHQSIDDGKSSQSAQSAGQEEGSGHGFSVQEQLQHFGDHVEGAKNVDHGSDQGEEKDQQDLTVDAAADFPFAQPHLLHDLIPFLVIVPFGDLLEIDDEHSAQQKEQAQEQP